MSRLRRIGYAFVIAIGMLLFSYWVTNQPFLLNGSELGLMRYVELVNGFFNPQDKNNVPDSVMLINVSYDPVLVVTGSQNDGAIPTGYEFITDREKLLQLLVELKRRDDYKYILLDVSFSDNKDYQTEADSALFNTILSMDRIVIPRLHGEDLADKRLNKKAGFVNYYTNFKFDSFSKYPYLVDGQESLPLKMYEDISGNRIDAHGLFPTENSWPVRRSILLPFEIRIDTETPYKENGEPVWLNLGKDLLRCSFNESIKGDEQLYKMSTQGKYIVIGAFSGNNDKHYTYIGNQPGPIILFNAFLVLMHQGHRLHFLVFLVMFFVFLVMSYSILGKEKEQKKTEQENKRLSKFTKVVNAVGDFIASVAKYSFVLTILAIVTYTWIGVAYDIFITALMFKILKGLISLCRKFKKN